jgi:L-amino acid N-acyltransferase YncA
VIIRPITAADHEMVWQIFHEVVAPGDTYAFAPDTTRDEAIRLWVDVPQATYVADDDGSIVGTYFLKPNQPGLGSHVCNAGYMVKRAARGRGLGELLCQHSLAEARRLGFRAMQFNFVVATNPAVRLWTKMGFSIIGRLPLAFREANGAYGDALIMYQLL